MTTPGAIVWQDLITTDPQAAIDFYSELFAWTIEVSDEPGYGTIRIVYASQTAIAGIETDSGNSAAQPYWLPYILVPDTLEAACDRAVSAGGTVVQFPIEYAAFGRYAVLSDPDGARFAMFERIEGSDFTIEPPNPDPQPGSVSWYAVSGGDSATTAAFYSAVFGYDAADGSGEALPDDHIVLKTGEDLHAGVLSHGGSMPSQWLIYFVVDDIDSIPKRTVELGGGVVTPIVNIPEIGRIVGLTDPAGATFFAHQPE